MLCCMCTFFFSDSICWIMLSSLRGLLRKQKHLTSLKSYFLMFIYILKLLFNCFLASPVSLYLHEETKIGNTPMRYVIIPISFDNHYYVYGNDDDTSYEWLLLCLSQFLYYMAMITMCRRMITISDKRLISTISYRNDPYN